VWLHAVGWGGCIFRQSVLCNRTCRMACFGVDE
jgi:hypothetical protein